MKWYNKDKTTMVDTATVNYYHFDIHNESLTLIINGHSTSLEGIEAKELFAELYFQGKNKQLLTEEGQLL